MTPRVTVLVPVYNAAAHLGSAIESVLTQTFDDFELLMVDDGSTDDSIAIARSYPDERIRILENERNLGQVPSMNRGLQEASGEYVARLDADDACLPARLARQVEVLDRDPRVGLVATWMDGHDESGAVRWQIRETIPDYATFVFRILIGNMGIAHPTVMYRRDAVVALGGYDEAVALSEDQDLWRRMALARHDARIVTEVLVRYRMHGSQQSQRHAELQRARNNDAHERFIEELAPGTPTRTLRLALTDASAFWRSTRSRRDALRAEDSLERLLAGARERLELSEADSATLERLLRAHIASMALRSWRNGVLGYWRTSPPLARFGRRRAAHAIRYVAAPALAALRHGRRAVTRRRR